jgi:hypothetical protein
MSANKRVRPEAPQVPASLRLLLHTLKLTRPDALATALPFARAMLSDMNLDDPDAHLGEFLEAYHKKGSIFARVVESSDGDIAVAFTEPGVVLGIALAFVLLTDHGGVR